MFRALATFLRIHDPRRNSAPDLIGYMLTGAVVYGLSVLVLKYDLATDVTHLFASITSNLSSAM